MRSAAERMRDGSGWKATLRALRTPSGSVRMVFAAVKLAPSAVWMVTDPGVHSSDVTGESSRIRAPACFRAAGEIAGHNIVTVDGT